MEGYAAAVCEPEQVQGDFQDAVKAVGTYLDEVKPDDGTMRSLFEGLKTGKLEQYGSAWGYMENRIRNQHSQSSISEIWNFRWML